MKRLGVNKPWKSWPTNLPTPERPGTIGRFYRRWILPKTSDEDTRRREFILNVLLIGSIIFSAIALAVVSVNFVRLGDNYRGASPILVAIPALIFISLYFLSRIGRGKLAASIFIFLYFLLATFTLYQWGNILPMGLLLYALVIVMAGILIGTKIAFVVSIIVSGALFTLTYAQTSGLISPNLYWTSELSGPDDILVYVFLFAVLFLVSWLSNREIDKSLFRARHAEKELKKERDSLEGKVEERTKQLKRAQVEKMAQLYRFAEFGKMASGLFHDLVNPLTAVSLNLEQLNTRERSKLVNRAIEGTRRMERYIESARRQIQQQKEQELFSMNDEIKRAVDVLDHRSKKAHLAIDFKPNATTQIFGDPLQFNKVITNLLSNAIDAYDGITRKTKRRITVHLERVNSTARLSVQDMGIGIPRTAARKIFEPFFTTKSFEKGTGIGLAICKEIIEKEFHGTIKATSSPRTGTTFTIEIPIKES